MVRGPVHRTPCADLIHPNVPAAAPNRLIGDGLAVGGPCGVVLEASRRTYLDGIGESGRVYLICRKEVDDETPGENRKCERGPLHDLPTTQPMSWRCVPETVINDDTCVRNVVYPLPWILL